jgi:hypothetical protein
MDDVVAVVDGLREARGGVEDGTVVSIDGVLVTEGGSGGSDSMVARASGAGAAHVSLVAMEQWTPVATSLLQQAHSPVVALYVISGKSSVAAWGQRQYGPQAQVALATYCNGASPGQLHFGTSSRCMTAGRTRSQQRWASYSGRCHWTCKRRHRHSTQWGWCCYMGCRSCSR